MPLYNDMFELTVEDIDLIETALRSSAEALSLDAQEDDADTVRRIHDLLGRLHNQKVFYRPRDEVYLGG